MFGNHGNWAAGDWLAMSFMMVLFWGLVIALIFWVARSGHGSGNHGFGGPLQRADDLLAERFARGEIEEEEFTRRRLVLHPRPVVAHGVEGGVHGG